MQNKSKIWEKILQERINRYTKSTSLRNRYQADSKNKGIVNNKGDGKHKHNCNCKVKGRVRI